MSNILIAFLVAISASAWVYSKMMRRTGNNTKSSVTAAGVTGLICFFVIWSIVVMIDSALK